MGCLFSSEKKVEKSRLIIHAHNGSNESPVRPLSPPPSSHSPPRTPPASRATIPPARSSSNQLRPTLSSAVPGAALPSIETLTSDIGTKWAKALSTFPIATDFPRLARLTSIYVGAEQRDVTHQILDSNGDGDGDPHLRHYGDDQTVEETLYAALITLAIHLHDSSALDKTKKHFWEFHKGDIEGEVARNFGLFLKSNIEDGSNVACVLKTINQAILAPAIIALKMAISTLPFKDFRNSWKVKILISNDDFVDVVHVRREQSFISQQPEEMRFEFVWELRIRLALGSAGAAGSTSTTTLPTINGTNTDNNNINTNTNTNTNGHTFTNNTDTTIISSITDKRVQNVSLQIVEIAIGPGVPANNRERILGEMGKITASNCVITTMPA